MATRASADSAAAASVPPCTMANRACPAFASPSSRCFANARFDRSAQRSEKLHRPFDFLALGRQLDAFVELHLDIRTQEALDLDRALGRNMWREAVEVALELHALFRDLADLRQAHDLEAAAIGKDRLFPAHERMQPAEFGYAFRARPQHEVIRVAEQDIGA